jgi:hypothetical protein
MQRHQAAVVGRGEAQQQMLARQAQPRTRHRDRSTVASCRNAQVAVPDHRTGQGAVEHAGGVPDRVTLGHDLYGAR